MFLVGLFATQNRDFLLEKDAQHTHKITKQPFLLLVFGYEVNVRFNFRSRSNASRHASFISYSICVGFQSRHN